MQRSGTALIARVRVGATVHQYSDHLGASLALPRRCSGVLPAAVPGHRIRTRIQQ